MVHELFEKEVIVVDKINRYNKKNNPERFRSEGSAALIYQDYLTRISDGFKKKMYEIENL